MALMLLIFSNVFHYLLHSALREHQHIGINDVVRVHVVELVTGHVRQVAVRQVNIIVIIRRQEQYFLVVCLQSFQY